MKIGGKMVPFYEGETSKVYVESMVWQSWKRGLVKRLLLATLQGYFVLPTLIQDLEAFWVFLLAPP